METFSAFLAFCAENSLVTGEFPAQRPVTWGFDIIFDLRLNQQLGKHWRCRWFEAPSCSLWHHCNVALSHGDSITESYLHSEKSSNNSGLGSNTYLYLIPFKQCIWILWKWEHISDCRWLKMGCICILWGKVYHIFSLISQTLLALCHAGNFVKIGSGNGLVPTGNKPAFEPVLMCPQWSPLAITGLILVLRPANERLCYFVMTPLIGWAQA